MKIWQNESNPDGYRRKTNRILYQALRQEKATMAANRIQTNSVKRGNDKISDVATDNQTFFCAVGSR